MQDEAGNFFFDVKGNNYKIPKLNWREEDKFLGLLRSAGVVFGSEVDNDIDIFSDAGKSLRSYVFSKCYVSTDGTNYSPLNDAKQDAVFSGATEAYEVFGGAVGGISSFLDQAEQSTPASSEALPETDSGSTSSAIKRKTTVNS